MSGGQNNSPPRSMTYPNGRVLLINYDYRSENGGHALFAAGIKYVPTRRQNPGAGEKTSRGKPPAPGKSPPTPDDLAGIAVTADGDEDLTVRGRKPQP